MSEWLNVTNPETGGTARLPDQPGVRERYEALGWVVGEPVDPDAVTWSAPDDVDPDDSGWVFLYHSVTGAVHEFPTHPDALKGAFDAGWREEPATVEKTDKPSRKKTVPATDTVKTEKADPASDEGE